MKKGIYAILAMLTVFAMVMVSCGGGGSSGGGGGGATVKITFDLNYTDAPAAKEVKVGVKTPLGTKYPGAPADADVPDGKVFLEWNSEKDGEGNLASPIAKYAVDTTVYAIWADYDEDDDVILTFNYNYGPNFTVTRVVASDNALANFPVTPGQQGSFFRGWFDVAAATGGNRVTSDDIFSADKTYYARWAPNGSKPEPFADELRIDYKDGSFQFVVFKSGETTWADVLAKLARKTDVWNEANRFLGWKKTGDSQWAASDDVTSSAKIEAAWMSGTFTGDTTGAEKTYLQNADYAVYEFTFADNVTKADLAKIKGFKASYGLSEAALDIYKNNGRPWRVLGPYFYLGEDKTVDEKNDAGNTVRTWTGDFMVDSRDPANGIAAKFENGDPGNFNKFHTYMCLSADSWNSTTAGVGHGSVSAEPTANTWFTVTYELDMADDANASVGGGTYSLGKTLRWLDGILDDGKYETKDILAEAPLPTKKLYFALGITRNNDGSGKGKSGQQSPWESGIIALVKDVKLMYDKEGDGSEIVEINGVKPSLTVTKGVGANATKVTSDQVFAGYVDPIHFGWRGAPDAPVVMKADPTYIPIPPSGALALSSYTYKAPELKLYQNDKRKDGTGQLITIADNKITFAIGADDYNDGEGKFGGGGFKILFDDIGLPDNYTAYKRIVLDIGLSETFTDGRQMIFSAPDGGDVVSVSGSSNKYITITEGSYSIVATLLTMAPDKDVGIAVRANNWSSSNVPIEGVLTVKRITFTLD
jgi:hypothetical protein